MTIYKTTNRTAVNYRRIYEKHYGPIPKEINGRKYEIHHIDGNSHNNTLENLVALTLRDHYDLHYSQGDWAACLKIAAKMKLSSDEISNVAKLNHRTRLENGTHPWQKRADGSSHTKDRISKPGYKNPFTGVNHTGSNNPRYNDTVYIFYNTISGQTVNMTRYQFINAYPVDPGSVSRLLHGKYKIHRGWTIVC